MDYEWDDAKAAANLAKHWVDFVDAIGALADPNRIEGIGANVFCNEERTRTVGMTRGNILFVVTTMRDEDLCRIISGFAQGDIDRGLARLLIQALIW